MAKLHLVMPMAGRGSRFFENGFVMPKPLIEINDRPFFYWATQSIVKFVDCADITFVVLEEHIRDHAPDVLFTVLMRRSMLRIAKLVADQSEMEALITGESLAQVASQTMQGLVCTDAVSQIPIFRPLIGMDKTEIVETARQIDTFELSTLPYEDCCTVFTPKHPKVRPSLEEVEAAQAHYDFTASVEKAVANTEMKIFKLQNGTPFSI